jgi:RNase P/RNase MRP subunit p30
MSRAYADLWVSADPEILKRLKALRYSACAVEMGEGEALTQLIRRTAEEYGISAVGKRIFRASKRQEILERLRGRPEKILISVMPLSREALMVALRDERVDTVIAHGEMAEIDRNVLEVYQNPLELSLSTVRSSLKDVRRLRNIVRLCQACVAREKPLIISSGARSVHELRKPRQMAYLLSALSGSHNPEEGSVSETPYAVLRRCVGDV